LGSLRFGLLLGDSIAENTQQLVNISST